MSFKVVSWAMEHSQSTLASRLVMFVLAEHAHDDGTMAFPCVEEIARKAKIGESTARSCLRRLEEIGEVQPMGRTRKGTVIYRVLMGGQNLGGQNRAGARIEHVGGQNRAERGPGSGPEPSLNPSGNHHERAQARGDGFEEDHSKTEGATGATTESAVDSGGQATLLSDGATPTRPRRSVNRKVVSKQEWQMVEGIVAAFNDAFATRFKPTTGDVTSKVVMQIREHPEITLERHRQIIEAAKADPWWGNEKPDTIGVIYGPNVFPRAMAKDPPRIVRNPYRRETGNGGWRVSFGGDDDD